MSNKRNENRNQSRVNNQIEEMIHLRTVKLAEEVLKGYKKRLNGYLESSSKEFKEQKVEYDRIELVLEKEWILPNDQQKMNIEKLRDVKIKDKDLILTVKVKREHYKEEEKLEAYTVWSTTGIQTEVLNTKKVVEIVSLESLVGYLAEKGIEYIEAERSLYKQFDPKQPSQEVEQGASA